MTLTKAMTCVSKGQSTSIRICVAEIAAEIEELFAADIGRTNANWENYI